MRKKHREIDSFSMDPRHGDTNLDSYSYSCNYLVVTIQIYPNALYIFGSVKCYKLRF